MYCRDCKYIITRDKGITNKCPVCGSIYLIPKGFTTEKIQANKELIKKENGSFTTRLASSLVMLIASLITALIIWFLAWFFLGRISGFSFPIEFIMYFTSIFTVAGFFLPNITLGIIGGFWHRIYKLLKEFGNYNGPM